MTPIKSKFGNEQKKEIDLILQNEDWCKKFRDSDIEWKCIKYLVSDYYLKNRVD